jgi:nicotinate-nucleotide adenylyltransferase
LKPLTQYTGLYFGSFNPIHIGHLAIANYLVEFAQLQELWFVVSPQNPLKQKQSLLSDYQRLELVNRSIADYPKFKASTIEFSLPKPSYTTDTLAYLDEKFPQRKFALIMGEDNLSSLDKWKNFELLLEKRKVLCYPRPGNDITKFHEHPNVHIVEAPLMEISSSFIRKAVGENKNMQFFMHPKAWEYMDEMNFYR